MKLHNITDEVKLLENFELDLVSLVHDTFIKRPVAWQDLFDSGVELPPTTVLGVWKSWTMTDSVMDTTAAGYDIVFSACWYLDHLNDDWWSFYKCNPRGFSNLTVAQQSHILGGHSSMWGERVDSTDFFERVWPRTSAVAEVLWSGGPRNYSDLSYSLLQERLSKFRCWMVQQFDIPVSPIEPGFCAGVPLQKGPLSQSD